MAVATFSKSSRLSRPRGGPRRARTARCGSGASRDSASTFISSHQAVVAERELDLRLVGDRRRAPGALRSGIVATTIAPRFCGREPGGEHHGAVRRAQQHAVSGDDAQSRREAPEAMRLTRARGARRRSPVQVSAPAARGSARPGLPRRADRGAPPPRWSGPGSRAPGSSIQERRATDAGGGRRSRTKVSTCAVSATGGGLRLRHRGQPGAWRAMTSFWISVVRLRRSGAHAPRGTGAPRRFHARLRSRPRIWTAPSTIALRGLGRVHLGHRRPPWSRAPLLGLWSTPLGIRVARMRRRLGRHLRDACAWVSWNSASFRPNCTRDSAWILASDSSSARRARPSAAAPTVGAEGVEGASWRSGTPVPRLADEVRPPSTRQPSKRQPSRAGAAPRRRYDSVKADSPGAFRIDHDGAQATGAGRRRLVLGAREDTT